MAQSHRYELIIRYWCDFCKNIIDDKPKYAVEIDNIIHFFCSKQCLLLFFQRSEDTYSYCFTHSYFKCPNCEGVFSRWHHESGKFLCPFCGLERLTYKPDKKKETISVLPPEELKNTSFTAGEPLECPKCGRKLFY